jgi:hypothetical protein
MVAGAGAKVDIANRAAPVACAPVPVAIAAIA